MSVYIVSDGTTYRDIKSVSFIPEYDPTLDTLPICEYEAEIVTEDTPGDFMGKWAHLREDLGYENAANDVLAGYYEVREAEQVGQGVVRIRARSLLDYLERRTLPAELFQNVGYTTFVRRLFLDPPVNEGEPQWYDEDDVPVTLGSGVGYNEAVAGFCPQQTARERLQWFLQSDMLRCVQFGKLAENGLYITHSPDKNTSSYTNNQPTLYIQPENTYKQPKIKRTGSTTACEIVTYSGFTYTETKGKDWTSSVIRQDWDVETEQWVDVPVYYKQHSYPYDDGTDAANGSVQINGNTLMYYSRTGVYNSIAQTYFRRYEAEVDILQIKRDGTDDTYIWPGDRVWFHADMETIYTGVVKSVDFTFGKMARSKLVISTDMTPVSTGTLVAEYQYYYSGAFHTFMTHAYRLPPYTYVYIPVPLKTSCWDGAKIVHLERAGDQSWVHENGPAAGQTKTRAVYYNRSL